MRPKKYNRHKILTTKVYELLSDPDRHTRGFCLLGAIHRCYSEEQCTEIISKVMQNMPRNYKYITQFNDDAPYEEIIELCRKLDI